MGRCEQLWGFIHKLSRFGLLLWRLGADRTHNMTGNIFGTFLSTRRSARTSSAQSASPAKEDVANTFEVNITRGPQTVFGVLLKNADSKVHPGGGTGVQLAFVGPGLLQAAGLQVNDVLVSINGSPCSCGHQAASQLLSEIVGTAALQVLRPPPSASFTSRMFGTFSRREHPKAPAPVPTAPGNDAAADDAAKQEDAAKMLQAHARGFAARHAGASASVPDHLGSDAGQSWIQRCLPPAFERCLAPAFERCSARPAVADLQA